MTLGEKIRTSRVNAGLTQKELGDKLGIDSATIGKYERGKLNPKFETVKKIADALNIRPLDLYPDKFFRADYEPMNKEEKDFRNDAVQALVDNVAVDLGNFHKTLEDNSLEAEKKLKSYCEKRFSNLNAAGIQMAILSAVFIMGDDIMPDEVIVSIAKGDWSKSAEIIKAIEMISNTPSYQIVPTGTASKDPSSK